LAALRAFTAWACCGGRDEAGSALPHPITIANNEHKSSSAIIDKAFLSVFGVKESHSFG